MTENGWNTNSYPTVIDVPREETESLLAKVLGITSLGFLITAFGVATAPEWATFPGMIAVLGLVLAITFARKASPMLALGLFLTLTYFMGWEIGPLIHRYVRTVGPTVVSMQQRPRGWDGGHGLRCEPLPDQLPPHCGHRLRGATAADHRRHRQHVFSFHDAGYLPWLTLGIFTLLTVGDFARIRAGGDGQSAVSLSLSIYLDAINIFLAVLQLLSGRRSRN